MFDRSPSLLFSYASANSKECWKKKKIESLSSQAWNYFFPFGKKKKSGLGKWRFPYFVAIFSFRWLHFHSLLNAYLWWFLMYACRKKIVLRTILFKKFLIRIRSPRIDSHWVRFKSGRVKNFLIYFHFFVMSFFKVRDWILCVFQLFKYVHLYFWGKSTLRYQKLLFTGILAGILVI